MNEITKRNKLYMFLLPGIAFLLGITLSFFITRFLPGDPVLAYLPPGPINPILYAQMYHELGFDQPIFLQFLRYLGDFFTGKLGYSVSINLGQPIFDLLLERIPATLEFTIIPITLGLIAGILLGVLSVKVRYRLVKLLIQILIVLGISMPMFFIGMGFQYTLAYQLDLFPATRNPFLPSCILFLLTLFLTTRQVRSNYLEDLENKHILSNNIWVIFNVGILISSIFLLETIFNLGGFFELIVIALRNADYWAIRACLSILVVLVVIILLLTNIFYTIYNNALEKSQSIVFTKYFGRDEQVVEERARYDFNSNQKFKDFTIYRLKSPLTIIGLAIVAFTIVIAIFPQVLTPFSMEDTLGIYLNPWSPPSPTHPLGQTSFGRDVLALLAYGVSTSVKVSIVSVLIGILVGTSLGYLCKVHRVLKEIVLVFLVIFFILPSILMILILRSISGNTLEIILAIITMYMIPGVTLLISKGNYSYKLTLKRIIAYFPLFMGFNILLFEAIAFLGFSNPMIIQLGNDISRARAHLYDAPWASLWPGLALFILVMGFISLHYGLKEPIPIAGRL